MRLLISLGFCVAASAACAQSQNLPELFTVKDVAADDKLNIRLEPNPKADIVGHFEPSQSGIEVVAKSSDGAWSKVNSGEASGWVASQFLEVQPNTWVSGQSPENLTCVGTEPFWSVSTLKGALSFKTPDGGDQPWTEAKTIDRGFEGDRNRIILAKAGSEQVTAVIQPNQCSDGMSDRSFGLSATLIFQGGENGPQAYYGCCSIAQ